MECPMQEFTKTIIARTLRVPAVDGASGDGTGVARQLDAVLVRTGFKASRELLEHVGALEPGTAMDLALTVLGALRELVGDHVQQNTYFINFPEGVPDTVEFWISCLREALVSRVGADGGVLSDEELMQALPGINLLALPTYGTYQHTYAEMVAAHDDLIPSVKDRVTVVHLGKPLAEEVSNLYLSLVEQTTPLGEADLQLLHQLAKACLHGPQPAEIPIRENRAVINAARLDIGAELIAVDTVTDVLRVACQYSGGDVSLGTPTKFRSLRTSRRRVLMRALEAVVIDSPAKLGDVGRHVEQWKRLGEGLRPSDFPSLPHAQDVFRVARGEKTALSLAGRVEQAFAGGDLARAAQLLTAAPGMLLRQLDRLLRTAEPGQVDDVLKIVASVVDQVSGRVLLGVREHLANRAVPDAARVFTNQAKRSWVTMDTRRPLDAAVIGQATAVLDDVLARRVPVSEQLVVVDPDVLDVALPLSGKADGDGFGVLPRGSVSRIDGELLRFFCYWRETAQRTDYDLSLLMLDDQFGFQGQVSWTNYGVDGVYYSGDITSAADGATEFIDVPLGGTSAHYLVPQVNVYSGESFTDVAESMFGFMTQERAQRGQPFEPATVRMRSQMRGAGRVALPVVFICGEDGRWSAKWTHLYQRGAGWGNRVEANRMSTALLAQSIVQREYLPVSYLVGMMAAKVGGYVEYAADLQFDGPVTFIGLRAPEGLPEGSTVVTLDTLHQLIPE